MTIVDSLPPTGEDFKLDYKGFWNCDSHCRIRIYRQDASLGVPVVIVATEMPDNEGTSVTNLAEMVFRMAWSRAGEPWPVTFIEHYTAQRMIGESEHWDFVTFPTSVSGLPILREDMKTGTVITESSTCDALSETIAFGTPEWKHADAGAVEAAIGTHLLHPDAVQSGGEMTPDNTITPRPLDRYGDPIEPVTRTYVDDSIDDAISEIEVTRIRIRDDRRDIAAIPGSDPSQLQRLIALQALCDRFVEDCEALRDGPIVDDGNDDVAACMDIAERIEYHQAAANDWNEDHPVGTVLRYWRGIREGEPDGIGPTSSPATVVGSSAVAWIKGAGSCIALTHVEVVREGDA